MKQSLTSQLQSNDQRDKMLMHYLSLLQRLVLEKKQLEQQLACNCGGEQFTPSIPNTNVNNTTQSNCDQCSTTINTQLISQLKNVLAAKRQEWPKNNKTMSKFEQDSIEYKIDTVFDTCVNKRTLILLKDKQKEIESIIDQAQTAATQNDNNNNNNNDESMSQCPTNTEEKKNGSENGVNTNSNNVNCENRKPMSYNYKYKRNPYILRQQRLSMLIEMEKELEFESSLIGEMKEKDTRYESGFESNQNKTYWKANDVLHVPFSNEEGLIVEKVLEIAQLRKLLILGDENDESDEKRCRSRSSRYMFKSSQDEIENLFRLTNYDDDYCYNYANDNKCKDDLISVIWANCKSILPYRNVSDIWKYILDNYKHNYNYNDNFQSSIDDTHNDNTNDNTNDNCKRSSSSGSINSNSSSNESDLCMDCNIESESDGSESANVNLISIDITGRKKLSMDELELDSNCYFVAKFGTLIKQNGRKNGASKVKVIWKQLDT